MEKHTIEGTQHFISLEERAQLARLCAAIVDDGDTVEDLTQETLLEAWRCELALHSYRGGL